jgi:D-apionate oxidoisomerase
MTNATTIALFGAGGKMGCRITDNLRGSANTMHYVEVSAGGLANLAQRHLTATPEAEAIRDAHVVILAVPDALIGAIASTLVPRLRSGTLVIALDPAAPHNGELPTRADIAYFVAHPCHPSVFNHEVDPVAQRDFFGGIRAKQHIVCALMQGDDADYQRGEQLARLMYAPVVNAHRITVEQMAILEPALSETTAATCLTIVREALDEVIRLGVPPAAARDFLLGHLNIELAILFGEIGAPFSDGAKMAIERAKSHIFRADWKRVFEPANIRESIRAITAGTALSQRSGTP